MQVVLNDLHCNVTIIFWSFKLHKSCISLTCIYYIKMRLHWIERRKEGLVISEFKMKFSIPILFLPIMFPLSHTLLTLPYRQPKILRFSSLNTLGVSWLHDSDVLSLLNPSSSHLSYLNLAESNITDISLIHLANSSKVTFKPFAFFKIRKSKQGSTFKVFYFSLKPQSLKLVIKKWVNLLQKCPTFIFKYKARNM